MQIKLKENLKMAQQYNKKITTPIGTMAYPWLTPGNPDIKFGAPGHYKVSLTISGPEAKEFVDKMNVIKAEGLAHLQKTNPKLQDLVMPIDEAKDEAGNIIPDSWVVRAKAKAAFRNPDGTETPNNLIRVDANKKPMPDDIAIWSGTKGKLALSVGAIDVSVYKGIVLRLAAVQVTELVEGGGSNTMFDKEDGYSAPAEAPKETRVVTESVEEDEEIHF
jgi:hypothetical protein